MFSGSPQSDRYSDSLTINRSEEVKQKKEMKAGQTKIIYFLH